MCFVTTWTFHRLSKCQKVAQSDVQKSKFISVFDIYFYFKPHNWQLNFSQLGVPLSLCPRVIEKFVSVPRGVLSLVYPPSLWAYSDIATSPFTVVLSIHTGLHILPCSRAHVFFRCYSGVLGKLASWNVGLFFLMLWGP